MVTSGDGRKFWATMDFKDFSPRKGFVCREYFSDKQIVL